MLKFNQHYIPGFDGLRAIAIFMVMIAHWLQWQFSNVIMLNFPFVNGVTLFFVLSGFLITKILLENKEKYEQAFLPKKKLLTFFYIRRALRIFPIYYLIIIVLFLFDYKNTRSVSPWLFTYTSNIYQSVYDTYLENFGHFWSLAVEEQFYLVWPLLIIFANKKYVLYIIALAILISVATKVYIFLYIHSWIAGSYFTLSCMHSLAFGALTAYWYIYKPDFIKKISKAYIIIIVSMLYLTFYAALTYYELRWCKEILNDPFVSLLSALIVANISRNNLTYFFKILLENKFIVHMGSISYGLYVYHSFIPEIFLYLSPKIGLVVSSKYVWFLLFYLTTFCVAHLSWKYIEQPINNLKNRFPYIK